MYLELVPFSETNLYNIRTLKASLPYIKQSYIYALAPAAELIKTNTVHLTKVIIINCDE